MKRNRNINNDLYFLTTIISKMVTGNVTYSHFPIDDYFKITIANRRINFNYSIELSLYALINCEPAILANTIVCDYKKKFLKEILR